MEKEKVQLLAVATILCAEFFFFANVHRNLCDFALLAKLS